MSRLIIAFVGQCHTVGYAGVPADTAFPSVCRNVLQASRPNHTVEVLAEQYGHPADLLKAVRFALLQHPRVVVIEVVGWLAISGNTGIDLSRLPRGVRSAYQRAQHLRRASRLIAKRTPDPGLIFQVQKNALALASNVLRPLLPRLPRPTIAEYENALTAALALIRSTPGTTAVVQGPGAPRFTMQAKGLASDIMERYRAVTEMGGRVAAAHGALFVDRWDTVAGEFFISGTTRPTARGHSVWGHLLADHLLREGLV